MIYLGSRRHFFAACSTVKDKASRSSRKSSPSVFSVIIGLFSKCCCVFMNDAPPHPLLRRRHPHYPLTLHWMHLHNPCGARQKHHQISPTLPVVWRHQQDR